MRIGSKILCVALVAALGCSSDDDGGNGGGGGGPNEGVFLDSAVSGMGFSSGDEDGNTNTQGTFQYPDGATEISFTVGDIEIGTGTPGPVMTPMDLVPSAFDVTDNEVTNIARFMQTIDDDANPSNGIAVTQAVRDAAAGQSLNFNQTPSAFDQDTNVQSVVASLTTETQAGARTLVDASTAQDHLRDTIQASFAGSYSGNYCKFISNGGEIPEFVEAGSWTMEIDVDGNVSMDFNGNPGFSAEGTITSQGVFAVSNEDEQSGAAGEFLDGEPFGIWGTNEYTGNFGKNLDCDDYIPDF